MKSLNSSSRSLRTIITDLIIYGNLAFTFVFFSAAFDRGCNNSSGKEKVNEIAGSVKNTVSPLLAEKGQSRNGVIVSSGK
ncbi:MAG: hypothetical protein ACM3H8_03365 [Sphingobacteriales bacterium]